MKISSPQEYDNLKRCVLSAVSGWQFVKAPKGFGWAKDRHFRAILGNGVKHQNVVIRQCWTDKGYEIERYLYQSVLPNLAIRTPKLVGAFRLNSKKSKWIILEDLGEKQPDMNIASNRALFLETLGCLHGQGLNLVENENLSDNPLPTFRPENAECQEWKSSLMTALDSRSYDIEQWTIDLLDELAFRLGREPLTLLHGDTDPSNAILTRTCLTCASSFFYCKCS